jgi:hypothetical protein
VYVKGILQSTVDKFNAPQLDKPLEHLTIEDLQQLPPFAPGKSPNFRGFAPSFVPCKVYSLLGLPVNPSRARQV